MSASAVLCLSVTAWLLTLDHVIYKDEGHVLLIALSLFVSVALVSFISGCCTYL